MTVNETDVTTPSAVPQSDELALEVEGLQTFFFTRQGTVKAVDGVSFHLNKKETLGIVGESGCGKSITALSVMRLVPDPPGKIIGGRVTLDGRDLLKCNDDEMREIRGNEISMIFQEPMTSLNPVLTIGHQIAEALILHQGMTKEQALNRSREMLDLVKIPEAALRINEYPHQLSGGMRQRAMIAMALACNPKVLIADEPTTALDVTIQAQILDLVKGLRRESGMAIIWITHDLGVMAGLADRVMVMYGGLVVERAGVGTLYKHPRHPYTRGLLSTLPRLDGTRAERLTSIAGQPPNLDRPPEACPFAPRCGHAFERCWRENPVLEEAAEGHEVACWLDPETGAAQ